MSTDTPENKKARHSALSYALPALVFFFLCAAIRLIPWNRTLAGWDEWILTSIFVRLGQWALPKGELYEILVPTGYSYPPFYLWLNGLMVYVFGSSPLVWRILTILFDAGCAAMAYFLGRRVGGRLTGYICGILSVVAPYLSFHDTVTLDFALTFWILLSIYLFLRAQDNDNVRMLLWSVFFGSIACFTKYHGVVYFATLCVMLVAIPGTRKLIQGKKIFLFAGTALFLPCVLLAVEGLTWKFYGWQKTHVAEVFRVMEWTSWVADFGSDAYVKPKWHYYFVYCWIHLGPAICVLSLAGMGTMLLKPTRDVKYLLIILVVWMLWASSSGLKNARYVLPMVYVAFVFVGLEIKALSERRWGKAMASIIVIVMLGTSSWRLAGRVQDYLATSDRHEQVYEVINENIVEGDLVFSEAVSFQIPFGTRFGLMRGKVIGPSQKTWRNDFDYIIAQEDAFEMLKTGVIVDVHGEYLRQRESFVREWDVLLDTGEGKQRTRVLRRPVGRS